MGNKLLLVSTFITAFSFSVLAQAEKTEEVIELRSNGCEIDESNFNEVSQNARKNMGEKDALIVIARRGTRDKKRDLNRLRLATTRAWLVGKGAFPTNRLILAEGERVDGEGRLEFYIGGKLTHIIFPKPNFGLCAECCSGR